MIKIYDNFDIKILKKYNNKIKDYSDKAEIKWYWRSPCNCIGDIKHNDGGNYHSQLLFYKFDIENENKEVFLLIKTDTRDKVFATENKKYVFYLGEKYYYLLELEEWEDLLYYEIVEF